MLSPEDRWEHGGAIELPEIAIPATVHSGESSLERRFATARQALVSLLNVLKSQHAGATLWLPDLWCHAVTLEARTALEDSMLIAHYPASPYGLVAPPAERGDVVLLSSLFGRIPQFALAGDVCVIADLSHGLVGLSASSSRIDRFDYRVASLRKLSPVPDGAVLTAKRGFPLPAQPNIDESYEAFARELTRLLVAKSKFLRDRIGDKSDFYPALAVMEASLGDWRTPTDQSSMGRARSMNINLLDVAEKARRNAFWFASAVQEKVAPGAAESQDASVAVDGGGTFIGLTCATVALRDRVREELILRRVWPSVLWPLPDEVPASDGTRRWVETTLVLNADARYDAAWMRGLAGVVDAAVRAADGHLIVRSEA